MKKIISMSLAALMLMLLLVTATSCGMEGITGYTYEPWHYRFVGREAATDIYFGKLTLEEYLGQ